MTTMIRKLPIVLHARNLVFYLY